MRLLHQDPDLTMGAVLDLLENILPDYVLCFQTIANEVKKFNKTLILCPMTYMDDDPFGELFYLSIFPCLLVLTGCTPEIS